MTDKNELLRATVKRQGSQLATQVEFQSCAVDEGIAAISNVVAAFVKTAACAMEKEPMEAVAMAAHCLTKTYTESFSILLEMMLNELPDADKAKALITFSEVFIANRSQLEKMYDAKPRSWN